jgi:hypothetical protein
MIKVAMKFTLLLGLLTGAHTVFAQAAQELAKPPDTIQKINVAEAMEKSQTDDSMSMLFVEQLGAAHATEAVPILELKFERASSELDKAHIAAVLVRLGDKKDVYWDYLTAAVTKTIENDVPNFNAFDSNGKSIPGPSPEFVAWADKKKLPHEGLLEEHVYYAPGPTMFLAHTDDPRAIPLLRRALWSPNFMVEIFAAKGLARLQDKASIPWIIEACKLAPAEVAGAIGESLAYFDDPVAQAAVDLYVPKELAKLAREAAASGKKPLS